MLLVLVSVLLPQLCLKFVPCNIFRKFVERSGMKDRRPSITIHTLLHTEEVVTAYPELELELLLSEMYG